MPGRAIFRDIIDPNSAVIRQQLIAKIQPHLDPPGSLLVYTANPGHLFAFIMSQDAPLLEDLLRTLDSKVGYLMVTSPGGDPNAAEKMLIMCRERFTDGFFVIVPNYAKSAATMIALGGDKVFVLTGIQGVLNPREGLCQSRGVDVALDGLCVGQSGGSALADVVMVLRELNSKAGPPDVQAVGIHVSDACVYGFQASLVAFPKCPWLQDIEMHYEEEVKRCRIQGRLILL